MIAMTVGAMTNQTVALVPTETSVQQRVRIEHCEKTMGQMWRNNVGACEDATGRMVRYGLGNDSAQLNRVVKSSDLIGITPTLITPEMVGYSLGVFTAYEIKAPGWRMPTPMPGRELKDQPDATQRALAQQRFHDIVRAACGFAGFVTDPGDIDRIIRRCR